MGSLRPSQSRTRLRRLEAKVIDSYGDQDHDELTNNSDDEPPTKRLRTSRKSSARSRWVPGGRGGGGRRLDTNEAGSQPATPTVTPADEEVFRPPRPRRRDPSRRTAASRSSGRNRRSGATRPRYSTAAAATAAAAHGDGYKPREERGWEEFHPDLDLDSAFAVIDCLEIDGITKTKPGEFEQDDEDSTPLTPQRRKPGRPQRTRDSMLQALLMPEQPKFVPKPGPNPRERLILPKPSYRILDAFSSYEHKEHAAVNFVNQAMANVGYQESDLYIRPDRTFIRQTEGSAEEDLDLSPDLMAAGSNSAIGGSGVGRVEYDMDEQDVKWLEAFNKTRVDEGIAAIKPAIFEITMTKVEKEWHALEKRIPKPNPKAPQTQRPRSGSAAAVNGEPNGEEPDSKCAICDDGDCENANAIVFCDGCDLAVHQECYGVPYIPEGQWLCRKCQLVGNARPSCIFCPNEGGAFKQTNNSKWAHLLCATWIPEVTIGNPSLMEPITDVEKVPNSRWKLHCYICRQAMGASIQCSDGRCYEAFHLTCARQAGLYLKMKIGGGQNTLMDPSTLRAYCHRHTPADWRAEHQTDRAFEHAVKYYKVHFQGQIWADSRASALAITEPPETPLTANTLKVTLTNKKGQKPKTIWRLPSGAPVVPEVILKSMEESLVRFSVPKKKEYVSEVCKYWTLKREARRGAALLKRLQLQMDTFSSFEVTRRDYQAQGAAGRARLERRIEFAETLTKDLERIRNICELIKVREQERLVNARLLKDLVDTVYFPIPLLLGPILDRAIKLDPKGVYHEGLSSVRLRLDNRFYNSVAAFSSDFAKIFTADLGFDAANKENLSALYERPALTTDVEQRERRTLARRIVKAAQPFLENALRNEAELTGRPFEQQLREMEQMLFSRRASLIVDGMATAADTPNGLIQDQGLETTNIKPSQEEGAAAAITPTATHDTSLHLEDGIPSEILENEERTLTNGHTGVSPTVEETLHGLPVLSKTAPANTPPASTNGILQPKLSGGHSAGEESTANGVEPPTPPMSTRLGEPVALNGMKNTLYDSGTDLIEPSALGDDNALGVESTEVEAEGGIPWYVETFDPVGTTIYDERWTGQDVLREMSEELSEMDEDELQGMDLGELTEIFDDGAINDSKTNGDSSGHRNSHAAKAAGKGNAGGRTASGLALKSDATTGRNLRKGKKSKKVNHGWSDRSFRVRR